MILEHFQKLNVKITLYFEIYYLFETILIIDGVNQSLKIIKFMSRMNDLSRTN